MHLCKRQVFRSLVAILFCWSVGFSWMASVFAGDVANDVKPTTGPVAYETFGAVGDGVNDDLPAICRAHAYANEHRLGIRSKPNATYHLGREAMTAIIATDTDWNSSKFIIDDTEVDDHKKALFEVRSLLESKSLKINALKRDQRRTNLHPSHDCHVVVFDDDIKRYRRKGSNQNSGNGQTDCFILHRNGSIEGDIDWDYPRLMRVEARPIDQKPIFVRGGVFTTTANRMQQKVGYNYWSRNIRILRSNVEVIGLTHHVVGETEFGHPYSGFLSIQKCANVTLRDCFFTGHKTYRTIGNAGEPVSMGSYDISARSVVNFRMMGCRMDNILDPSLWGVIATNHCKNILLDDCVLSRMDVHMGVSGSYTIRRCVLGRAGLNAIGRGLLTVEDTKLQGTSMIDFRRDYGSTWEGDIVIRNCQWIPNGGKRIWPTLLHVENDGLHDFGYACFMPEKVAIDGLFVDDSKVPNNYTGMYLFSDPDSGKIGLGSERPFPYLQTKIVEIRRLTTASGKLPRVSSSTDLSNRIIVHRTSAKN